MTRLTDFSQTIVALATALGSGSIAVIRVSGGNAIGIVNRIFKGQDLIQADVNSIHFGRIMNNNREIDQVLVSKFKAPNSYTGEDYLEISCHANPFIIDTIIDLLIKNGAAHAKQGEFTLRAFLNGKMDLSQAEAVADIINAKSRKGIQNNLLLLEGALGQKINKIKEELINLISYLELSLDFIEEDLEVISSQEVIERLSGLIKQIDKLIAGYNYGKMIDRGLQVVIMGRPNVGKSTLMNTFLGQNRVITSAIPGTTRDLVSEYVIIDQISIKLTDTAGIRITSNEIELEGAKRAESQAKNADLILFLVDISKKWIKDDRILISRILTSYKVNLIIVGNKMDLGENLLTKKRIKELNLPFISISAIEGKNLDKLKKLMKNVITREYEKIGEEIIISSARHKDVLTRTRESLLNASKCLDKTKGFEFAAADLRESLHSLGEITGEVVTEEILNTIFTNFCIGK